MKIILVSVVAQTYSYVYTHFGPFIWIFLCITFTDETPQILTT